MKFLIKRVLKESFDDRGYQLIKKLFTINDDIEFQIQIFIDNWPSGMEMSNLYGEEITSVQMCKDDYECICEFYRDMVDWCDRMLQRDDILNKIFDNNDFSDELPPYKYMELGFTGEEVMTYYRRLFLELSEKNDC
jgi:hypothetical protein